MTVPDLTRIRHGYHDVIAELRGQMSDDAIVDVLERYRAGGIDRDEAMEMLAINYLGTLYELVAVYQIAEPPVDQVEEARQAEMLRLLLNDEEVPVELRQPLSWKIRH